MSGHSHWSQIQRKKGANDQKRGLLFSKLLKAISITARENPDPQFNPRLRTMIDKARAANVPNDNIDRAIKKSSGTSNLSEVLIEAYGPEGCAILVEGITDNKNRTISEIKHILSQNDAKIAELGSVLWSFEKRDNEWVSKFSNQISEESIKKIDKLISLLEDHPDVQRVITNTK
ncbi:MAG: hypothetical protein COU07_03700 [Candidatus Harrisonbacteria bacterium CG10_big_fil_rev_8_21_14_0_10_40_38]|uniref:YebC/PmpR family DNA-binding transcriptional regulator n=1 Tax=Candidatus Harrisonbacteria bacterium CG10_big_fil_rev_8_21_14_0_10_40_38 TaxID=1974583 RepID=A0A2H0URE8_9BACT|nr:MAG: hypothetical protein COU07_03700 [Candidatus Harrisonbacteria bacterium CG10_big_fil_rev_8_21_14_0_10_40_38]